MTRKDTSRLLAAITGVLVFGAASVFAGMEGTDGSATGIAGVPGAADTVTEVGDTLRVARGRKLFREVGCTGCHAAEGVGSPRILLDGVGSRLSADTLRLWIVAPREVDPGVRKPAYDDLPPEDVAALVAYMESLEEPDDR